MDTSVHEVSGDGHLSDETLNTHELVGHVAAKSSRAHEIGSKVTFEADPDDLGLVEEALLFGLALGELGFGPLPNQIMKDCGNPDNVLSTSAIGLTQRIQRQREPVVNKLRLRPLQILEHPLLSFGPDCFDLHNPQSN